MMETFSLNFSIFCSQCKSVDKRLHLCFGVNKVSRPKNAINYGLGLKIGVKAK